MQHQRIANEKYISSNTIIIIMFKQFVDRHKELKWLEKTYKEKHNSFLIIYGRRRVGKTELIKYFSKDKPHIYFLAGTKLDNENIADLQNIMGDFLKDELFKRIEFRGWEDIFKEFIKKIDRPIIIIIDEFPYLIEQNKAIPSIFQKIWDENLKNEQLMLILCGSSIGMMETDVLGYKSPLYGRRTGQWKLEPFKFKILKQFFPNHSFNDRLQFYSILDGIPAYLSKMNAEKSPTWNLKNRIFKKGEYLYEEAENLLRQEFREPRNYFSIIQAIAEGNTKYGEICNRTSLSKSMASQYLKNLIDLHVVTKEYPVTQRKESRNARYALSDNYYDFWFEFIYPNRSLIEEDRQEILMKNIKERLQIHSSSVFEQVCREMIWNVSPDISRVGRWWQKSEEIDIIGLNEKENTILFGECKWSKNKVDIKLLDDLKQKSECIKWKIGKRTEKFILFSKSGFTEELESMAQEKTDLELYDIDRLETVANHDR